MGFFEWLFGVKKTRKNKKRVFISFAVEDIRYRDYLIEQARKNHSPFDLIDMSVKQPWTNYEWKAKCRTKIRGCDCMIVLLSKYTKNASGVNWEIKCGKEAKIPIRVMHVKKNDKQPIHHELKGLKTMEWSWENLKNYLK